MRCFSPGVVSSETMRSRGTHIAIGPINGQSQIDRLKLGRRVIGTDIEINRE